MLASGLLPKENLAEFQRWGFLPPGEIPDIPTPTNPEQLTANLEYALQQEDLVIIRETDLESLKHYLSTMRPGTLHVVNGDTSGDVTVMYGVNNFGEYILPWTSDGIEDILTNGETYLIDESKTRVYFSSVRELFYGEVKAFVVCKGSRWETANGHDQTANTLTQ
jgi:hypothetical protein